MFGVYRYILALAVVISHLSGIMILGWLAVHGFFILSGYLITLILHRNYGYGKAGFFRFIINRTLRLFPVYWCVLLGTFVLLLIAGPAQSEAFHPRMSIPETGKGWAANISLIYPYWFPAKALNVMSPPSWTLTIEWLFYVLMALGLSRKRGVTLIWLALALVYFVATHLAGLSLTWRYSTLMAGALPFAMGASLYHFEPLLKRYKTRLEGKTLRGWLSVLLILNALFCSIGMAEDWSGLISVTFYTNMVLNLGLIANLSLRPKPNGSSLAEKIDKIAGDLSYSTYLLHIPVAFGIFYFVLETPGQGYEATFMALLLTTIILCAVLGGILNQAVDKPIQKVRERVRDSKI